MRCFFLEQSTLDTLVSGPHQAVAGDRIVFFRDAQDISGEATSLLRSRGVSVEFGYDRLTYTDFQEIDELLKQFTKQWYLSEGTDVSHGGIMGLTLALNSTCVSNPSIL